MIKIYFNTPSFVSVNKITQAVIVLRNTKSFCKKLFILPSRVINSLHICKCKRIAKRRLAYTDITVCVPFFIVSPGEVYFMFPYLLSRSPGGGSRYDLTTGLLCQTE